jgi:hypothetical protein
MYAGKGFNSFRLTATVSGMLAFLIFLTSVRVTGFFSDSSAASADAYKRKSLQP